MAQSVLEILLKMTGADKAKNDVKSLDSQLKKLGGTMTHAGTVMTASVTAPLIGLGVVAVKAASDLAESMNKVDVVFGDSSKVIKDFADDAAVNLGLSNQQALEAAGTFGNLFTSMGMGQDEAAGLSTNLLTLASDLGSFNNIDPTVALEKLRSGLVGEVEPLRALGINLSEAAVEEKALELGMISAGEEMTAAQKVTARYALIMEQTKNAQGDFARTSDGLANSTRTLKAQFADAAAELGQQLLPIALDMVQGAKELIAKFSALDEGTKGNIVKFAGLAAAMGPALMVGGKLVTVFGSLAKAYKSYQAAMAAGKITTSGMITSMGAMALAGIAVVAVLKEWDRVQDQVAQGMEENQSDWQKFFQVQIDGGKSAVEVAEAYRAKQEELKKIFKEMPIGLKPFIDQQKILEGDTQALKDAVFETSETFMEYRAALAAAGLAGEGLEYAEYAAAKAVTATTKAVEAATEAEIAAAEATEKWAEEQKKLKGELDQLMGFIDGALGPEIEDFNKTQEDTRDRQAEIKEEIQKLIDQGYSPLGEEIMGLQGEYDELETAYGEQAAAHEEATKRILFDLLTQRAAMDGLSADELVVITEIATNWGLIDEATAEATLAMDGALTALAEGAGVEAVINTVDAIGQKFVDAKDTGDKALTELSSSAGMAAMQAEMSELAGKAQYLNDQLDELNGKTVTATALINFITDYSGVGASGKGQHGANFIVPPGFPNDTFPMFVSSGEHVEVTPNYNLNIHTNAPYEPIVQDFQMMRAMSRI